MKHVSVLLYVWLTVFAAISITHTAADDCDPNPCLNGGICIDGVNSFTCECEDGYSGETCEINDDDCDPNPCLNGGTCTDGVNMFTCDCTDYFTGEICETGEHKYCIFKIDLTLLLH